MRLYFTSEEADVISWRQASTPIVPLTAARRDYHRMLEADDSYALGQAVYGVVSSVGAQTITPTLLSNGNSFFSPTMLPGLVTITPGLLQNSNVFFAPLMVDGSALQPVMIVNEQVFFNPTVNAGAVTITPSLLQNSNEFFSPRIEYLFPTSTAPSLYRVNVPADAEMQVLEKFIKQPADVQDYDIDYTEFLSAFADSPSSIPAVVAADEGITVRYAVLVSGTIKVWLADGVDGMSYKVSVTLTTAGGRVRQTEFSLRVKEI